MEVPQKNCMVYNNGISFEHGWFRCTPISGNLHMLEKGLKHVAWWMSRWNWWTRGWPARLKHETGVESVHIYVRLLGNHWKPSKTIFNQGNLPIRQRPSRLVASRTWTRWHDDTMKRWQQQHQQQQKQQQQQQQQLNYSTNRASLAAMAFYKLLIDGAGNGDKSGDRRSAIKADGWMMMMDGWMMLNDSGWRKEQVDGKKER